MVCMRAAMPFARCSGCTTNGRQLPPPCIPKKKDPEPDPSEAARPLFGEVADARLKALAGALGGTCEVSFAK